ncbi:TetR/AcrR family transcriptional regulator [Nocardia panacis]|uniref:TetR/AcrR family transcriptional regulator n=1 Tax=Nocardia panacis TaxID=2340916 RepID=A0A3A4KT13_9NOCA|nr:TetR/AcrR family transcriptional regulator [Nocardia panacis]
MTIVGRQYGGRAVVERKAERRLRFLAAATRIFAERGYAACSLADVCAAAGLSKRQFYEEFRTREDVLVAAYDRVQDEAVAAIYTALTRLEPGPDLRTTLIELFAAFLSSMGSDPHRAKLAFVEVVGVSERMERHRRERRRAWGAVLETIVLPAIAPNCRLRGGTIWATSAFIGVTNGLAYEWLVADPHPPIEELVNLLVPVALTLIEFS